MIKQLISALNNHGEMGQLTRLFNWADTPIGPAELWPQSLLTTLSIMLNSKFPMFLWWGPQLIQFYNDAYRPSLGNSGKHPAALGQGAEECSPEIWPIIKPLIGQVMSGGESTWSEDQLIPFYRNNKLEDVYWTFSYSRVDDENGEPAGVLVICNETTAKVQTLNAINQASANLKMAQAETENQRDRLTRFFMQAPAGICVLGGPNLVFELVNPLYQQLLPGRKLLNRPIFEALPELMGQPLQRTLLNVYGTGETYVVHELLIPVAEYEGGPMRDRYFSFNYLPRINEEAKVDGILVYVFEVTEMVQSRMELAKAQANLKMAVTAAQLGTFDMDLTAGTMYWDKRCRTLFGISHENAVSYETDFLTGLHPDDRQRVEKVINNVFIKSKSNGNYDVEYRTIGVEDKQLRWVRAMGKAYFNEEDKPLRFVGSVMDITERKTDELRKDDFIGMVSHELKTPLTSLYAIVQVLNAKLKNSGDVFISGAVAKPTPR